MLQKVADWLNSGKRASSISGTMAIPTAEEIEAAQKAAEAQAMLQQSTEQRRRQPRGRLPSLQDFVLTVPPPAPAAE